MNEMIILDIETQGFDVECGIYEVAMLVVENYEIKDKLHIGIIDDESLISNGYGEGYEDISCNDDCINTFKSFIDKYNYPIVAHNANFDRKFLLHYNWLSEDYPVYDSMRAIKYENPNLFSYAMQYLLNYYQLDSIQNHTALKDVYDLYNLLCLIKPSTWIATGKSKSYKKNNKKFNAKDLENVEVVNDLFKDKNIVFTGKGPYPRVELSLIAMKSGATVLNGVNKKTDILVVGEDAGSKLTKANDLGIEILSIDDFMDITSSLTDELDNIHKSRISNFNTTHNSRIPSFNSENKYLEGLTISLVPMRLKMAEKLSSIIENLGGNAITTFRQKETDLLIYEMYGEDFVTVEKAKSKNIKTIPIHEFNRLLVDGDLETYICEFDSTL